MKKIVVFAISMGVALSLLAGCAHRSSSKEQSLTDESKVGVIEQVVTEQSETENHTPQSVSVLMDEKLDENLYIQAELCMPGIILYEYSTELKNFDYDEALEIINANAEGTIGGETGSLSYQRNDMANHLDTYCSYAEEQGMSNDRDLSFMSKAEAVERIQGLMNQFQAGGDLSILSVVAMDQSDFYNVQAAIMSDDDYKGMLAAKGYENDIFEEKLETYRITFQVEVNKIPMYRNVPFLQQTSEQFIAHPVTVNVLISNSGIEMVSMMGMIEPYEEQRTEVAIIGEDGIKKALIKKFGDVLLPVEYKAVNIWMEYFPLLREGSFTQIDLVPVWCIDFEIDGESVEESKYTLRFNAITGEEIS